MSDEKMILAFDRDGQERVAARLRHLADDIDAGRVTILDEYESVLLVDTTPPDASWRTCATDRNSHLRLLRYRRL